jgi:cytochrome P450
MTAPQAAKHLHDDLLAPELIADPHPALAALREHDPVHWSDAHRGWLITRYDDVADGLKDHRRLSSDRIGPLLRKMSPERRGEIGAVMELLQDFMIAKDPPEHGRLRRLVTRAFRPARVEAMERRITAVADELLADFVDQRKTDFAKEIAYPFPATVIAELIGAPPEDRPLLQRWSDDLALVALGGGSETHPDRHTRAQTGLQQMLDYFDALIERARAQPGEDMVSGLLEGDGAGNALAHEEMKSMCALMLFGGHETTTGLLSAGLWLLSKAPDQFEALRRDPASRAGAAVEEMLRFEPSVKVIVRRAAVDYELRNRQIRAGDRVHLVIAAANRDPSKFQRPDEIDIGRSPNPHLAFGKGIHACIGSQLARIEARVMFTRLFDRLPDLRVPDQPVSWHDSAASRSLRSLRVAYDASTG